MALVNCPECTHKISDKATACPHCGYAVSQNLAAPSLDTVARSQPNAVQALKCPCCGAKISPSAADCEFCGSYVRVMAAEKHVQCSHCQTDLVEGKSFCSKCGTLQFLSEHLRDLATKTQFSQDKYRKRFPPAIRQQFADDEFIYVSNFNTVSKMAFNFSLEKFNADKTLKYKITASRIKWRTSPPAKIGAVVAMGR